MDVSVALAGWSLGSGPLYRRLAAALRDAIRRGELGAASRLPSERHLARALDTSRTTVVAAYRLLREEGLLESRPGSGTRVAHGASWAPSTPAAAMPSLKLLSGAPEGVIDCSASVVPDLDVAQGQILRLAAGELRRLAGEFDYRPLGLPPLRAAIAERLSRQGLPTSPGEVIVTTGAQQAIELLFAVFGADHGTIGVENPTYVGALDAVRTAGATVVGIDTDAEGVEIGHLRDRLARSTIRLLYLMPGGQNPTGAVMGPVRRRQVTRATADVGVPVLDDMTLADLMSQSNPVPLAVSAPRTVITVGSLSKVFWAGLRVGWIRAPEPVVERLARLKVVADLGSSHLSQILAIRALSTIDEMGAHRRRQLAERMDLLTGLLEEHVPEWSWQRPSGGPFLWVRMPRGGAEAFSHLALIHGVSVLPGSRLSPEGDFADRLRVSCVAPPVQLELAAKRLASAWSAFQAGASRVQLGVEAVV